MNEHSHLCRFIAAHPEDYERILHTEYDLRIKHDGALAIFNYNVTANFHDPIVQEARGIIIDTERCEVVCWPFRKFGNHNEGYADAIDWSNARVLEKVDGSIIKLWYDHARGAWQFSTNGTIRAELAGVEGQVGLSYGDVLRSADNYADIPFDRLDRDATYIFELVSPKTRVVIEYGVTALYHLGTRSNITGQEREEDIGIQKPASYPLTCLADCLRAATMLNDGCEGDEVTNEGFVVVDGDYRRVKVKSPDYLVMHRLRLSGYLPKRECLLMLLEGGNSAELLLNLNPALLPTAKYYDYRLAELCRSADMLGDLARRLYEEYSGDRGAVARIITKHPLAFIAFRCLTTDQRGSELLRALPVERIAKLIPDYVPEDLNALFVDGVADNADGEGV